MKKGCNQYAPFVFSVPLDTVESIDFVFKQDGNIMKRATYPTDTVADATRNAVLVYFSAEETFEYSANPIMVDTKIYLKNSNVNPPTPIVKVFMTTTLFDRGD